MERELAIGVVREALVGPVDVIELIVEGVCQLVSENHLGERTGKGLHQAKGLVFRIIKAAHLGFNQLEIGVEQIHLDRNQPHHLRNGLLGSDLLGRARLVQALHGVAQELLLVRNRDGDLAQETLAPQRLDFGQDLRGERFQFFLSDGIGPVGLFLGKADRGRENEKQCKQNGFHGWLGDRSATEVLVYASGPGGARQ